MSNHPVLSSFLVALCVRVAFAALSSVVHEGVLIPDEEHYLEFAEVVLKGEIADYLPGYGLSSYHSTRTFMWPLVALFWLFGQVRFIGQLFAALLGAVTAAATAAVAGRVLRRAYALTAGLIVAMLPSQVLWSSAVLRESLIWAGLSIIAVVVGFSQRNNSTVRIIGSALVVGLLFIALVTTRIQTSILALCCVFPALLLGKGRRFVRTISAVCVFVLAPWLAGLGFGAITFTQQLSSTMGSAHAYMAVSANSSVIDISPQVSMTEDEALVKVLADEVLVKVLADEVLVKVLADEVLAEVLVDEVLAEALVDEVLAEVLVDEVLAEVLVDEVLAEVLVDEVLAEAVVDRLLNQSKRPVAAPFERSTGADCVARVEQETGETSGVSPRGGQLLEREQGEWLCVSDGHGASILVDNRLTTSISRIPRGLYDTMLRPLPWDSALSNPDLFFAGMESPLWIVLYGLSLYGFWKHRRNIVIMVFPALLVGAVAVSGAMTHGNLGTAFRHRGQLLFALAILSAGGLQAIADLRSEKRNSRIVAGSIETDQLRKN